MRPKTRVAPKASIRVFEWVNTTYGDTKGLRGSWLQHNSKVSDTTLLAFLALRAGPAEHSASGEGTQDATLCQKTQLVPETALRV